MKVVNRDQPVLIVTGAKGQSAVARFLSRVASQRDWCTRALAPSLSSDKIVTLNWVNAGSVTEPFLAPQ